MASTAAALTVMRAVVELRVALGRFLAPAVWLAARLQLVSRRALSVSIFDLTPHHHLSCA